MSAIRQARIASFGVTNSPERYLTNIPYGQYALARNTLAKDRLLPRAIEEYSKEHSGTVALEDGSIPLDGVHMNSITVSSLFCSEFPHGIQGVRISRGPMNEAQATIENAIWTDGPLWRDFRGRYHA